MQKNRRNKANRFVQPEHGANRFVQAGILVLAVLFIAVGIGRQEHLMVMQKAVRICLECIGIG